METSPLVGVRNRVPFPENVCQKRPLSPRPLGDLLAHPPVQRPEIVLHFAEIREEFPGKLDELLEPVPEGGSVQQGNVAPLNPGDLRVNVRPAPVELRYPRLRIGLASLRHLSEQLK
mgnify:CR=1 FL=1